MSEFNIAEFDKKPEKKERDPKKQNKFIKILKRVFVHNIGYKLLAVAVAVAVWLLLLI